MLKRAHKGTFHKIFSKHLQFYEALLLVERDYTTKGRQAHRIRRPRRAFRADHFS